MPLLCLRSCTGRLACIIVTLSLSLSQSCVHGSSSSLLWVPSVVVRLIEPASVSESESA